MKKAISLICISVMGIFVGCAYMNRTNVPISISDIVGAWEGVHFGLCYLDIKGNEKGYMVFLISDEDNEVLEIASISFLSNSFVMSLHEYNDNEETLKFEGRLIGPNIIGLSEVNVNSENYEEILFLMRESLVPELRQKAKDIIKGIQAKNT